MNPKEPIPVAILCRVSTKKQENERQERELTEVCDQNGWQVVEIIREVVSGAVKEEDRPGLGRVMDLVRERKIKKVLVHEVSRLSRKPSVALRVVEEMTGFGVSLYWHTQRMETLLPGGKRNAAAGIIMSIMSEFAQAEREMMIERVNSGLALARERGIKLGRPEGSEPRDKFLEKHSAAIRLIQAGKGLSVRQIAKLADVSTGTVVKITKMLKAA
jgi:DNA invertase Pin-like site-specific DNA recombinase